jgi:hypothetical protein
MNYKIGSLFIIAVSLLSSVSLAISSGSYQVTVQELNKKSTQLMGKQVTLSGRIDRILGNGAYIVTSTGVSKDSTDRILVFTLARSKAIQSKRQEVGMEASRLQEGDIVKIDGKVEQFNVGDEFNTFTPMQGSKTISESGQSTPFLLTEAWGIRKG